MKNKLLEKDEDIKNDMQSTRIKIRGKLSTGKDESEGKSGLIQNLYRYILSETNVRIAKTEKDFDKIVEQCVNYIQEYEWENGKSWGEVKKERIAKTIGEKVKGMERVKALNFMKHKPRSIDAKEHVESQIRKLKQIVTPIFEEGYEDILGEPVVTALHSVAYTQPQNDSILNAFMSDLDGIKFKIICAVRKFAEGFHPDGVNVEFMTTEVAVNKDKIDEPPIMFSQEIRKGNFSRQKTKRNNI